MAVEENLLRSALEPEEADYLLEVATLVAGGHPLDRREQLLLLTAVRWMLRREYWMERAINDAVVEAIEAFRGEP
jgi:hypothetical protein